jgi:hypothetical protein
VFADVKFTFLKTCLGSIHVSEIRATFQEIKMTLYAHETGVTANVSPRLETVIKNVEFTRRYTLSLLEDLTADDWFWTPADSSEKFTTHIAWQAGHIAMAEYGLMLFRQRGRDRDVDATLMSGKFRKLFLRGSEPHRDREGYPEPQEIIEVMDRVHRQVLKEIASFDGEQLDEPAEPPHAAFATRYGALLFAGGHEMLHAGQIGLLRRLMGKAPLR